MYFLKEYKRSSLWQFDSVTRDQLNMNTTTNPQGQICCPYEVQWASDEGTQSTILWATSDYHAELLLEDLKNNATIIGISVLTIK